MAPVVSSVTPNNGPQSGGTRVTILGSGFTPVVDVLFGELPATLFVVRSDTQIDAVAPPEPSGAPQEAIGVSVTGPTGTSPSGGSGTLFLYLAPINPSDPLVPPIPTTTVFTFVDNLRLLVGEPIPADGSEDDTRFTTDTLADCINRHNGNLYLAASEIWSAKAAMFSDMVDISESGSDRKFSQLFRQANTMADSYSKAGLAFQEALISRPVGVSARILDPSIGSTFDAVGAHPDLYAYLDPFQSATARFWPLVTILT